METTNIKDQLIDNIKGLREDIAHEVLDFVFKTSLYRTNYSNG